MRQAEKKRKKNLVPNSVRTQPEQETSKKNCKKIQKIKKINSGSISIQNGLSEAEKEREKFQFPISFILSPGKKIPKKIAKKLKLLKNFFPALFLVKTGWVGRESEKKILVPNSVPTPPGQENYE